tara:strand:+ start:2979 stop:3167 length:189 start_codon:yes stop_codon:yes gene_type:complete
MSDSKLETDWIHTSAMLSLVANVNAPKGKKFSPASFPNPFKGHKKMKPKGSIDALKIFVRKK